MKNMLFATVLVISGCSTILVRDADPDKSPRGIRVCGQQTYLFVGNDGTSVVTLPVMEGAYDVKPLTIFAKNDFSIEMTDCKLTTLKTNQDTSGFLTFLTTAGELAAKAAGAPVSAETVPTAGLSPGIYKLDEDGSIVRVVVTGGQ